MDEIRRNELKKRVAAARGEHGPVLPRMSPHDPMGTGSEALLLRPTAFPSLVLDSEWCMVNRGAYLTMAKWRERLREGPVTFAWARNASRDVPGKHGLKLSLGQAVLTSNGEIRAASRECAFDRSPLRFDPSLDRWSCEECGSAFSSEDGKALLPPATRPILTFSVRELEGGHRFALLPPDRKPRDGAVG
jgi:nitrite reductase/ring-hydroxylating ferredoxin subunit